MSEPETPRGGHAADEVARDADATADAQRERRSEALRRLARERLNTDDGGAAPAQPASTALSPALVSPLALPRRTHRPWRLLLALALLLAVAGAGLGYQLIHSRPSHPSAQLPSTLTLIPHNGDPTCLRDAAWSPDSQQVALIGYIGRCPVAEDISRQHSNNLFFTGQFQSAPSAIAIYDTRDGHFVQHIAPDDAIRPLITVPPAVIDAIEAVGLPASDALGLNYTHLLWSADGARLALTFNVFVPSAPPTVARPLSPGTLYEGVEVVAPRGGEKPQVLLRPLVDQRPSATIWDLTSGKVLATPAPPAPPGTLATLPPALAYRWGTDGLLRPDTPLPADPAAAPSPTVPVVPIGNPDGGAAFSIWQPGVIAGAVPGGVGLPSLPNVPNWNVDIAAWSPDGRYLAERITVQGLLASDQSATPEQRALAPYGWQGALLLPSRDAGLRLAVGQTEARGFGFGISPLLGVLASWRPDGRRIAVDVAGNTPSADSSPSTVFIYDTATARPLATLQIIPAHANLGGDPNAANILRWSPDGSRLLLVDTVVRAVTIWGPGKLPR